MGRLSGFSYREIVKKLRRRGFVFDPPGDILEGTVCAIQGTADQGEEGLQSGLVELGRFELG